MSRIIGIDPGATGAWCLLVNGGVHQVAMLPVIGGHLDPGVLLNDWRHASPDRFVLEAVHAMPGNSAVSMFKFGRNFGTLLGLIAALAKPLRLATPQAWKKAILPDTPKDKAAALAYVARNHQAIGVMLSARTKVEREAMADAICIADYGYDLDGRKDLP
jgi:crossover junction endodeoxyribonuclease RuvC